MIPGGYLELSIMGEQTMSSFTIKQTRVSVTFFIKPNGCLRFTMEPLNTLRNLTPVLYGVWWHKMCFFSPPWKFEVWTILDCKLVAPIWIVFSLLDRLHLWISNKINNYIIHKQLDNVTPFNFGFKNNNNLPLQVHLCSIWFLPPINSS
jgi:hypothetical protein